MKKIGRLIGFVLFFFFVMAIQLKTPYFLDDFVHNLCRTETASGEYIVSSQIIDSFEKLFESAIGQRFMYNGRMSDIMTMAVMFMGGGTGFAIANSFMLVIGGTLLSRLIFGRITLCFFLISAFCTFLILPDISMTLLWRSGAFNYFWGCVYYLAFLCLYEMRDKGKIIKLACLLFAFIFCANHECCGASLTGAVGLMMLLEIVQKKKRPDGFNVCLFIVAIAGFALTLASPGMWNRMEGDYNNASIMGTVVAVTQTAPYLCIPLVCLVAAIIRKRWSAFQEFSFLFIIANVFIVVMLISRVNPRVCFYMCVGILVFFMSTYRCIIERYYKTIACCAVIVLFAVGIPYYLSNKQASYYVQLAIEKSAKSDVVVFDSIDNPKMSEGFAISQALPFHYHRNWASYAYWKTQPFIVIFNSLVPDRKVYNAFPEMSLNQPQVYRTEDKCYIRLPESIVPDSSSKLKLTDENNKECGVARPYLYGFSIGFFNNFFDTKIMGFQHVVHMASDYDGKYHYVILYPAPPDNLYLSLPVYRNHSVWSDTYNVRLRSTESAEIEKL